MILIAATAIIWSNSFRGPADSAKMSGWVLELYESLFGPWPFPFGIRKAAHAVEFSVLGLLAGILLMDAVKLNWRHAENALLGGMLVSLIDESIQIVSNRGSQVQDILLDLAAYLIACSALTFPHRLLLRARTNKWDH